MLKRNMSLMGIVAIILVILVGCSNETDTIAKEQEETISQLETKLADIDQLLTESKVIIKDSVSEVDMLKENNEALSGALKESQDQLIALALEDESMPAAISPYPGMTVLVAATHVLDAMRTNDYATLASYVDPMNGVYVSPYQYIDFSYTMNLTDDNILNLATIPTIFPWGTEPGSGDIISLNMLDYFNSYVYDEDYFIAPVVGMNVVVSSGNMINNIATQFPTSDTVEFLFPSFDPSYEGLDWSSITLVFNTDSGMPMLLGIVHGAWTP